MSETKDHKCTHPVGECEILRTSEITPNGFNAVMDEDNPLLCHVLQCENAARYKCELKDPIKIITTLIKFEPTKHYHNVSDYKIIKMELEANNRNLLSMTKHLQESTSNVKIQAVITALKKNKCGDDKLDYADDWAIYTLEALLKGG